MEIYDRVAKVVAPKKAQLAIAEGEYAEAMTGLKAKQAELQIVLDKLAEMQAKLDELSKKKAALEAQYEDCNNKLERAEKLRAGLGGERVRWGEISQSLGPKYTNLLGDCLLSPERGPRQLQRGFMDVATGLGLETVDAEKWFCERRRCPSVVGSFVTMRDSEHMTTAYCIACYHGYYGLRHIPDLFLDI